MVRVKIYVEGGGDGNALRTRCREGFSRFFRRAGFDGRMPAIVACGSRNDAYQSFCMALENAGAEDFPLLLVDSEAPVNQAPWDHLRTRDNWAKPDGAADEHAHLMVQCMEAWFLADRRQLQRFYGQGFTANSLPQNQNVEQVAKADLLNSLDNATRNTKTKGRYRKGEHSFELLGGLDPDDVCRGSVHADRLIGTLNAKLGRR